VDVEVPTPTVEASKFQFGTQTLVNYGRKPYQIYYLNPTVETTSTAAIVRRNVDGRTALAAKKFVEFLTQPAGQTVFVQYGFRPVNSSIDLQSVPNSPWQQNIPGAEVNPPGQPLPPPDTGAIAEIQRLWERAK
jgi:ABC-type Fe3+ transport system substrate-binding protein